MGFFSRLAVALLLVLPTTLSVMDSAGLVRVGPSFFYTKLPSGVGYMYLRRVDSSITQGIQEAMKAHPDAHGWIVDLRGNGGGGYGQELLDEIKQLPRPVAGLIDAGCMSAGETLARDLRRTPDCLARKPPAHRARREIGGSLPGSPR